MPPARAVKIRPARPSDAAAIAAIYNEAVANSTATFDTQPRSLAAQRRWLREHEGRYPVLVAERDGRVLGWASLSEYSGRCAYRETAENSVYVAAGARGRGVGRALMKALLEESRRRKFHSVLARVAAGNPASMRLHESFGFALVGVMKEVGLKFGRRIDVALLQLML